jgi:hypothetical protein
VVAIVVGILEGKLRLANTGHAIERSASRDAS